MAPTATPLTKRLATYSAAAGVTLALAATADAQVVYTDVAPDVVADLQNTFDLDVDGDGTTDFQIGITEGGDNTAARALFLNAVDGATNGALGVDAPYFTNEAVGSVSNLDANAEVGAAGAFFPTGVLASIYGADNTPYYNFISTEGIVGFRFTAGAGTTHYGWARLAVNDNSEQITVQEYAFESMANTAISAGDKGGNTATDPDALADGYRFSAPAPNPVTGRSRFEVGVGQTEMVRIEVYDALGRSQVVLHDGALAGGAAQTFELESGTFPAGVYVVRVTGESFDSSRTVTVLR